MTSVRNYVKIAEKYAIDNSPGILTAVGVTGTVATAVLTGKATLRYQALRLDARLAQEDPNEKIEPRVLAPIMARCFAPPVIVGGLTIGAIIGANHIGTRRAAAMAAAYTISEKAFSEYKEHAIEALGEKKEAAVRDRIAQKRVDENPPSENNVLIIGTGEVRCLDLWSMRYFDSSVEAIKSAMNYTNYQVNNQGYASLTDFYDNVGLVRTAESDEVGWTSDKLLELEFSTALSPDGRPCVTFNFQTIPVRDYHRFR